VKANYRQNERQPVTDGLAEALSGFVTTVVTNPDPNREQRTKMATKNQMIELAIIQAVADNGQMSDAEIDSYLRESNEELEPKAIANMIVKLDRDGKLTRQNTEAPWQLTANGRGSLDGLRSKMEARYVAPYTDWGQVEAVFTFLTPTLGCITEPGNVGISKFPRLNGKDGPVMLLGGYILSAFRKAAEKGDSTVTVGKDGVRRTLPDVAWSRVRVSPITLPANQVIERAVRRPTNIRGQAIGEIVHECLPAGTTITIRASFPLSHFSEMYLVNLMHQVADTGISSAGTGKGGMWGVGLVSSLKINGRQCWPEHPEYIDPMRTQSARNLLESGHTSVLAPSVVGASATATEATGASNGHAEPLPSDDPRTRVTGGVRYVNGRGGTSGGK
jgi:hypothetical protein